MSSRKIDKHSAAVDDNRESDATNNSYRLFDLCRGSTLDMWRLLQDPASAGDVGCSVLAGGVKTARTASTAKIQSDQSVRERLKLQEQTVVTSDAVSWRWRISRRWRVVFHAPVWSATSVHAVLINASYLNHSTCCVTQVVVLTYENMEPYFERPLKSFLYTFTRRKKKNHTILSV